MSEFQKLMLKCLIVFSVLAMLSGALLGVVSQLTRISDSERAERVMQKIKKISDLDYEFVDISTSTNRENIDYVFRSATDDFAIVVNSYSKKGGDMQVIILISQSIITKITYGTNNETAGYLDRVLADADFIQQFVGKSITSLSDFFDNSEVDTVMSATMSSNAIVDGVKSATSFYKEFLVAR